MMIPATQLRSGMLIIHNGELHRVHDMVHKTPGNLRGFVQAKMRNVRSGSMNEHRFGSTDRVEKASLDEREMEYLYSDAAGHHFMDQTTYDQVTLSDEVIGEQMKYLLPNTAIHVDFYDGNPVGIELPNTVTLKVTETQPGHEGRDGVGVLQAGDARDGAAGDGAAVRRGRHPDQDRHARQQLPRESLGWPERRARAVCCFNIIN